MPPFETKPPQDPPLSLAQRIQNLKEMREAKKASMSEEELTQERAKLKKLEEMQKAGDQVIRKME